MPVKNVFVDSDGTCDELVNELVAKSMDTVTCTVEFMDGREHTRIVGDDDDGFYLQLLSLMVDNSPSELAEDCSNIDFSAAWQ